MKLTPETRTNILSGIFVGSLIAANLIGLKIANFWIFQASVGILLFPILFLVTDIIEEVHGKKKAQELVFVGFISLTIVLIVTVIAVSMPHVSRSVLASEDLQGAYDIIFGRTIRIFVASIIAFLIAQFHDVWAFDFWKKKTKGKYLWLRNNLSTIVSQFLDTTIFMFIALYGVTLNSLFDPANSEYTVEYLFILIIPYWLVKVLFAILDTPFCYLGVRWLKGSEKNKKHVKSKPN
ncbi:MAG: queuosine precursor transporter [Thermoplasmatales archaeon]|nr:MAG: queuosine precursor transporter [Thermoplasmatales archaeon]